MSKRTPHPHGSTGTPATAALQRHGIAFTVHTYDHHPAAQSYGLEAAQALGVAPDRVFKTLLVAYEHHLAVAVIPVDRMLDVKAAATALGVKRCALAEPADAERSSGSVVGGISPLGQKRTLATVLDESALLHATILVSGGRRGLDLELAPGDLIAVTSASTAAIAR